jgi:hypothetical protein
MAPLAISTALLGVLIVGGTVFVTVSLCSVVRKLPGGWLKDSQDAVSVMFSALGVLYAILLAFLVVVVWEQFNAAEDMTHQESTKISNLLRDANGFSVRDRQDIQRRLIVYTRAVVDWEWETMADGDASDVAASAYRHVWAGYYDLHPTDEEQHDWYSESLSKLNDLGELRRLRLISSQASIPLLMWTLLVAGGVLTVAFLYLFIIPNRFLQRLMIGTVSATLAFILFLILALDHPFAGDIAVDPSAYVDIIEAYEAGGYDRLP